MSKPTKPKRLSKRMWEEDGWWYWLAYGPDRGKYSLLRWHQVIGDWRLVDSPVLSFVAAAIREKIERERKTKKRRST
ncbi:MAG: hypothetical protein IMZ62_12830 [Chloroflexi bacterium]|nr:hypothetical protein [Chloroflexota bacterium]MBE3119736.1 hypothetical protein [Candidatus Atribacteria bacterium]